MKVKVNVKHVPLNQTEKFLNDALSEALADLDAAYRENERLLQENKDLRLAESRALSDKKKAEEDFYSIKGKFADVCAERDNWQSSYKQMVQGWLDAGKKQREAEQEAAALVIELKDREERIFILEQRIEMLQEENEEWRDTAEQLSTKVVNQNAEINRVTAERDSIPSSFWNFLVENGIVNKIEQGGNVYGNS